MDSVLCTLIFVILIWFLLIKKSRKLSMPGPRGWPIVGNSLALDRQFPHQTLEKWGKQFNGLYQVRVAMEDWVVVTKYEHVYELLVSKSYAFAGRQQSFRLAFISEGNKDIFSSDPTRVNWLPSRKLVQRQVKQFGDGLTKLEGLLSALMERLVTQVDLIQGASVDMRDIINELTVGVIYTLLTGAEMSENNEQLELFKSLQQSVISSMGVGDSVELDVFPWVRFLGHPTYLKLKKALAIKHNLWNELWAEKLKTYEVDKSECMLHAMANMIDQNSVFYHPDINEDFLRGILLDFINGGTATTLSSAYALLNILLHYPHVITKLQEEVDRVTHSSRRPTLADKDDMPYTMAVIYELLRYTSIAPAVGRLTLENTSLGGFDIPKNTIVVPHYWAIHHDEEFWGDPWIFRPERFLDSNGKLLIADHPNRKHLLAFGAGMRVCVGEIFALRRLFIFTTFILQSFNLLPDDICGMTSCDPRTYAVGIVLCPPTYRIKLLRRN